MPAEAVILAEINDLVMKLALTTDPDLKQAIQDRVDQLLPTIGRAPAYGLAKGVTKTNKEKH